MNGNYLVEQEISKTINKLELETTDEKLNLDTIKELINEMNLNYKTNNKTSLSEILDSLNDKFKTLTAIHDDNITVLKKNLNTYISTKEKVANMFNGIF